MMKVPDNVVPFTQPQATPQVDPKYLAMAAGLMHQEGRLFEPEGPATSAQAEPYTIHEGPEFDKWDAALHEHRTIRIPKELDNPQEWLNKPHNKKFLDRNEINRRDMPDGSVILSKKTPTS